MNINKHLPGRHNQKTHGGPLQISLIDAGGDPNRKTPKWLGDTSRRAWDNTVNSPNTALGVHLDEFAEKFGKRIDNDAGIGISHDGVTFFMNVFPDDDLDLVLAVKFKEPGGFSMPPRPTLSVRGAGKAGTHSIETQIDWDDALARYPKIGPSLDKFFKDMEDMARYVGCAAIHTTTREVPIELAAHRDYRALTVPFFPHEDDMVRSAAQYLADERGLEKLPTEEQIQNIAAELRYGISASDLLKIKHPNYPNVPLFHEFLTSESFDWGNRVAIEPGVELHKWLGDAVKKHLPGKHSQKTHGAHNVGLEGKKFVPIADKHNLDVYDDYHGMAIFAHKNGKGLPEEDLLKVSKEHADQIAVFSIPEGREKQDAPLIAKVVNDILDLHYKTLKLGTLVVVSAPLTLMAALNRGVGINLTADAIGFTKAALHHLENKYSLKKKPTEDEINSVVAKIEEVPLMPVEKLLDIRHPNYPKVRLFAEYMDHQPYSYIVER